jgi:hypothetical protein
MDILDLNTIFFFVFILKALHSSEYSGFGIVIAL